MFFKMASFLGMPCILQVLILSLALASAERDYLDDYFDKVVSNFNQKLNDAGLSSLSVKDVTLDFNRTLSGVEVVGTVAYKNGLVVDVAPLEAQKEGHRGEPNDDGVYLTYQINFPNLTMFADVSADLQPLGKADGTAELLFEDTSIAVYLEKNYTSGTTTLETQPYATMGPSTNFLPVSDVMDAAARLARLELGYRLLWDQVDDWCTRIITPMLSEAINEIEFPMFPPV